MMYREELDIKILEKIKSKIYTFLKNRNVENVDSLKQNMNKIARICVENSVENYGPKMQCRKDKAKNPFEIMIDKQFVKLDANNKPIGIDETISKLIISQLGHELLHAASMSNGFAGIKGSGTNAVGLDEGITQMITEKIFEYVVSPNNDSYKDFKKYAKILDATLGEKVMLNSYFNHTNDLEKSCNELSGDNNFYGDLNACITFMYKLRVYKNLDEHYQGLKQSIYDEMNELIIQKLCAQIVVPKLKTLSKDEQKKYLISVLNSVKDSQDVTEQFADAIKKFITKDETDLHKEVDRIGKDIINVAGRIKFIDKLRKTEDFSKLVVVDKDGKVFLADDPNVEIKDEMLLEKILSELYFQENGYPKDKDKIQKFIGKVSGKGNTSKDYEFDDNIKENVTEKKKLLATMKFLARKNGYLILNSLSEAEQSDNIEYNAIELPRENEPFSFQDLKKVLKEYKTEYESDENNQSRLIVKNRKTGERLTDKKLEQIAKFASIWREAAGSERRIDEEIGGIESAFDERSEKIFNKISKLISESMNETGTIDTQTLYREVSEESTKGEEIIRSLLANRTKLNIIYDFYKLQSPNKRLEVELPKIPSEFARKTSQSLWEPEDPNGTNMEDIIAMRIGEIIPLIPQIKDSNTQSAEKSKSLPRNEEYAQKAEKFSATHKNSGRLRINSVKELLKKSKIKMGEVQATQQEIAERNEYRRLKFQRRKGLNPEQQARYDALSEKYSTSGERDR